MSYLSPSTVVPVVQQVAVMTVPMGYWRSETPLVVLGSVRHFKALAVTRNFAVEAACASEASFPVTLVLSEAGVPRATGKRARATRATSFMMLKRDVV